MCVLVYMEYIRSIKERNYNHGKKIFFGDLEC